MSRAPVPGSALNHHTWGTALSSLAPVPHPPQPVSTSPPAVNRYIADRCRGADRPYPYPPPTHPVSNRTHQYSPTGGVKGTRGTATVADVRSGRWRSTELNGGGHRVPVQNSLHPGSDRQAPSCTASRDAVDDDILVDAHRVTGMCAPSRRLEWSSWMVCGVGFWLDNRPPRRPRSGPETRSCVIRSLSDLRTTTHHQPKYRRCCPLPTKLVQAHFNSARWGFWPDSAKSLASATHQGDLANVGSLLVTIALALRSPAAMRGGANQEYPRRSTS
jgi:hypothetical protein